MWDVKVVNSKEAMAVGDEGKAAHLRREKVRRDYLRYHVTVTQIVDRVRASGRRQSPAVLLRAKPSCVNSVVAFAIGFPFMDELTYQ